MILEWFNAREAAEIGTALADEFAGALATNGTSGGDLDRTLQDILRRVDDEPRVSSLNFFKRAKFANSFKWRLIEKGVDSKLVDQVVQPVLVHLSVRQTGLAPAVATPAASSKRPDAAKVHKLLAQGKKYFAEADYSNVIACNEELLKLDPDNAGALNNIGAALWSLDRYVEAEQYFREAVSANPNSPDASGNLGNVLRCKGQFGQSEAFLRRALKSNPNLTDAQCHLAFTLIGLGRLRDARARLRKVLKASPRRADATYGLGQIAAIEGRFDEAETMYARALKIDPRMAIAEAARVSLRKMTTSDRTWLDGAEKILASGVRPLDEAELRFAIGKYHDDVQDFERAFGSYKRANDLLKPLAEPYARDERRHFVDDLIRAHTRAAIAGAQRSASTSTVPIFVVGMPRSGTSLAEQIISSHPLARGAGELLFWNKTGIDYQGEIRRGLLDEPLRKQLAEAYLKALRGVAGDAPSIVDKASVNADYLGVIHSVFPNARIVYMRRDPIDACLSCYFQHLPLTLNYALDLADLAHYYRQHQRLMAHWRAILPSGTIFELPYAELVADQEGWTRKLLDFLGLEWDEKCLNFHQTKRSVATASFWQVRQKIYKDSVERWRNYEKFIGPLLSLKEP